MWFRVTVESGEAEHIKGPVWVGRVSSQMKWEDKTGMMAEWLAVEITMQGEWRLGWVTAVELDALVAEGDTELLQA